MTSLFRYERRDQPMATRAVFLMRLSRNVAVALVGVGVSLVVGMLGYHAYEGLNWLDAYDHAAMILSGMGPYREPATDAGKFFAGSYALYSGLFVVGTSTLILAPVFHRVLHSFHVPDDEEEKAAEKKPSPKTKMA
jgi:hypothetical protein